jgi:hypothetical protein
MANELPQEITVPFNQSQARSLLTAASALEPKAIEAQLTAETDRRKSINKFIRSALKDGVDYGKIRIGGRDSKNCLFKPGAEKFCSLLQLRAEFQKDEETLSMLQDSKNLVAFICRLIHIPTGNVVSEGRGACAMTEKQNMANTVIKIAEKRAKIDAVLSLGLSDTFTQDLDDLQVDAPVKKEVQEVKKVSPEETRKMADKLEPDSKQKLAQRMYASGRYSKEEVKASTGVEIK